MPRFIAIPVAQGDSFFLELEGFSLLVDGGRNRDNFPGLFQAVTKKDRVNVVLCTHNDADHAEGILGFLRAGLGCDEVWLPGRWLGVLPDILRPFVEVFQELIEDIAYMDVASNVESTQSIASPIEAYAERIHDHSIETFTLREGPHIIGNGWPEEYLSMLEQAESWEPLSIWPWICNPKNLPFGLSHYHYLKSKNVQLLWSAIDAASRIRQIATEAFHRGIPVRWFEFDTAQPCGGRRELQPLNGRQTAIVHPRVGSLLFALALTVWNKESLVFWSPATEQHPGVLFTADSDLAGINLPSQLDGAIVTAPHHGSEANANALQRVMEKVSNKITWVRSDGRYKSRPGNTYLGLSSRKSRKLCTICRQASGNSTKKQAVQLYSRSGAWIRHRNSQLCSCQ
ncbi:hypothetical protein [Chloroflexus sp.]|uniref:hypothetical protein n=1 Tax=Chloroflexus sp. TaxID=1904827 RepID=UPI00298F2C23|nr:hypothetical protein [Chloroflexus sp.]MCS6888032.1 hypothetical protein [Chloroflexus sp.]MDW8404688.1 hypothetical protein [Chloroflexus sp.]